MLAALLLPISATAQQHWVGTWAAAPQHVYDRHELPTTDYTLRQIAHVSMGGSTVRIRLSNEFGKTPLHVAAASIATHTTGDGIDPGSSRAVTFNGKGMVTLNPGTFLFSDRIAFNLAPLSEVAVDLYLPAQSVPALTEHIDAFQENYTAPGKQLASASLSTASKLGHWYFLDGIDVEAPAGAAAVVAFGDSITDGYGSAATANSRWPDVLAARLQANPATKNIGVLNEGISGNRLMRDRGGQSAITRFDHDVLAQSGVRYLIILEGINDIGAHNKPADPDDKVTAEALTGILKQLIDRAHARRIKVYGATLTPYRSDAVSIELQHQENDWIRTSHAFDAVIDFNRVTADPNDHDHLLKAYNFDNLHPGPDGYKAMGDSIDLSLFTP
jgi:lysophospholipase L1-like esterase